MIEERTRGRGRMTGIRYITPEDGPEVAEALRAKRAADLDAEAARRGIKVPTQATLKKYGLTSLDWLTLLEEQSWVCPIMGVTPSTGRFVIDHEHVPGWKAMPPEERKRYVRGLVSWYANHAYLGRGISVERAANVLAFLQRYEMRRPR